MNLVYQKRMTLMTLIIRTCTFFLSRENLKMKVSISCFWQQRQLLNLKKVKRTNNEYRKNNPCLIPDRLFAPSHVVVGWWLSWQLNHVIFADPWRLQSPSSSAPLLSQADGQKGKWKRNILIFVNMQLLKILVLHTNCTCTVCLWHIHCIHVHVLYCMRQVNAHA